MKNKEIMFFVIALLIAVGLLIGVLSFSGSIKNPVVCTKDAKICGDGSVVGRDWKNSCEFFPCPDENEEERHFCQPESREPAACVTLYLPVCGWNDPEKVNCVTYPCASTYSNSCFACQNEDVLYWTQGECPSA